MREYTTLKVSAPSVDLPMLGHLADPKALHEPLDISGSEPKLLIGQYRLMSTIRMAEDLIGHAVTKGEVVCPTHLAIGQEAVAVGVSEHLEKTDRVFGAHRSHGHFLALGASLRSLFAEVLGRSSGASRGMGGSMHLWAGAHGFAGSVPIVAGTVPLAVGAALAAKMDGGRAVAVVYLGDGSFEEGVVQESLNLASVMKLPVLFVAENNLFASHLRIDQRQPSDMLVRFAVANGIAHALVDGNDVVQVSKSAHALVHQCRNERTPGFLEAVTYRWRGHVGPREDQDVGVSRKVDLENWRRRDPLSRLAAALINHGMTTFDELETIKSSVQLEVNAAWTQACADEEASAEQLMGHVYAKPSSESATPGVFS